MIRIVCPNPALDRTVIVDELREGVPNRPLEVHEFPGGKGFNVAYAVARRTSAEKSDVRFAVYTVLGGRIGEKVRDLAEARSIPVVSLETANDTRSCNIVVEARTRKSYPIYEDGLQFSASDRERLGAAVTDGIGAGDWVVLSGSMPPGLRADFVAGVVRECRAANAQIVVDTSGPALVTAEEAGPTILKVNDEELSEAFDGAACDTTEQVASILRERVNQAIPLVIITRGARGTVARAGATVVELQGESISARNPVASGDIFLGNLVARLAQDRTRLDALSPGTADPAQTVERVISAVREAMSWAASNCLHDVPFVDLAEAADYARSIRWRPV